MKLGRLENSSLRIGGLSFALLRIGTATLLWAASVALAAPASPPIDLTVSAAVSLKEPLGTLRNLYHVEAPDVSVTLNLGASGVLQQQIEQGTPVDIFISASPREMNALEAGGWLLAGSRINLLRNTLVLICPSSSNRISGFIDLTQARVKRIAMADPESVPAGIYAEQSLKYFRLYDRLRPKLILAEDARQALAYVETRNVNAGIVYRTEARLSAKVKVVAEAPEVSHAPIVYPVAIIKTSPHADAARKFLQFLTSPQARRAFEQEGFAMAGNQVTGHR